MNYDAEIWPVISLGSDEIARCKELSYGNEGYMSEDLDAILEIETNKTYRKSQAILVKEQTKIIAWSLVIPIPRSPRCLGYFFVDPNYRGQGIGSYLFRSAKYISNKAILVFPDEDNEKFFQKFPGQYTT